MKLATYQCNLCDEKIEMPNQDVSFRKAPKDAKIWLDCSSLRIYTVTGNNKVHICEKCFLIITKAAQIEAINKKINIETL